MANQTNYVYQGPFVPGVWDAGVFPSRVFAGTGNQVLHVWSRHRPRLSHLHSPLPWPGHAAPQRRHKIVGTGQTAARKVPRHNPSRQAPLPRDVRTLTGHVTRRHQSATGNSPNPPSIQVVQFTRHRMAHHAGGQPQPDQARGKNRRRRLPLLNQSAQHVLAGKIHRPKRMVKEPWRLFGRPEARTRRRNVPHSGYAVAYPRRRKAVPARAYPPWWAPLAGRAHAPRTSKGQQASGPRIPRHRRGWTAWALPPYEGGAARARLHHKTAQTKPTPTRPLHGRRLFASANPAVATGWRGRARRHGPPHGGTEQARVARGRRGRQAALPLDRRLLAGAYRHRRYWPQFNTTGPASACKRRAVQRVRSAPPFAGDNRRGTPSPRRVALTAAQVVRRHRTARAVARSPQLGTTRRHKLPPTGAQALQVLHRHALAVGWKRSPAPLQTGETKRPAPTVRKAGGVTAAPVIRRHRLANGRLPSPGVLRGRVRRSLWRFLAEAGIIVAGPYYCITGQVWAPGAVAGDIVAG